MNLWYWVDTFTLPGWLHHLGLLIILAGTMMVAEWLQVTPQTKGLERYISLDMASPSIVMKSNRLFRIGFLLIVLGTFLQY